MSPPVIVLAGGGHARVLIDALRRLSVEVLGVSDADPSKAGGEILGATVIGGDEEVVKYAPGAVLLVNGLGTVGRDASRGLLFERFKAAGFQFAGVIHPSAVVAADAELSEGVQVMAGAVVQTGCRIGADVIINTGASVDHECVIGAHAHISPGAVLCGGVVVGAGSHVGAGATVIQGVRIGSGCLVAAGAVVTRDIPDGAAVAGVPAVMMAALP